MTTHATTDSREEPTKPGDDPLAGYFANLAGRAGFLCNRSLEASRRVRGATLDQRRSTAREFEQVLEDTIEGLKAHKETLRVFTQGNR